MTPRARSALLGLAALCLLLLAALAHAQPLSRGQWIQLGSDSLASAFWRAGSGDHYLGTGAGTGQTGQGALLTAGQTLMENSGGPGGFEGMYGYAGGGTFDVDRQEWVYCCTSGDGQWATNETVAINVTTGVVTRQMDPTVGIWVPRSRPWPSTTYAAGSNDLGAPGYLIDADHAYPDHVTPSIRGGLPAYPNAHQDYGCKVYMPSVKKIYMVGGVANHGASGGMPYAFEWDTVTRRWQMIDSEPPEGSEGIPNCIWDQDQQRVLISSGGQLRAYLPTAAPGSRVVSLIADTFDTQNDTGNALYDTKRHRLVKLGGSNTNNSGRYYDLDSSGNVIGNMNHPFTLTGCTCPNHMGPMWLYDPVIDKYVYFNGGQTLTYIDPVTFVATDQTYGGATPSSLLNAAAFGGYHKWFYNPATDTYNAAAITVQGPGLFVLAPVRAAPSASPPSIAFTDLIAGPPGAIVTLWGTDLGTAGTVTVGGVPASTVYYWGNATPPACGPANLSNTYMQLQCVIFQIAPTTPSGLQDVIVTVNGTRAPPTPFTVRPGRLLMVPGDFPSLQAALDDIDAQGSPQPPGGEIVYVKNGMDAPGGVRLPHQPLNPVALVVYPGHAVTVGDPTHNSFGAAFAGSGLGVNLIFSKFTAYADNASDGSRAALMVGTNGRGVGNLAKAPLQYNSSSACVGVVGNNASLLGNEITQCNATTHFNNLYHVVYLSGNRDGLGLLESNRFIEWNYIHDNGAARAINNYNANTPGDNPITGLRVRHNVIVNQAWSGIALLGGTVGENWVTDNLVINAGQAGPDGDTAGRLVCIELNPFWPPNVTPTMPSTLHIWRNTCINNGVGTASRGALFLNGNVDWFDLKDNRFDQSNGQPYLATGSAVPPKDPTKYANNVWLGAGPAPAWDTTGPPLPPPAKFTVGQTVTPTTLLNVRNKPGPPPWTTATDKALGQQAKGARAVVISGPVIADGAAWWQLDYATGVDGWSSENYLVPAPPLPVADFPFIVPPGKTYSINGGPIVTVP